MKNALYLTLLLIPCSLFAQSTEYGDFKIVNTELIYQKVFTQDSITAEKLAAFLKSAPGVSNVRMENGAVAADLNDFVVDYKKFQFSQVAVPHIIQTGRFSGKINTEVKDGKYRVTLTSIQMKGNIGYKTITAPESITNYACTNSGTNLSREWCKPNTLGLLDQALTDRFTYIDQKSSSDW